MGKNAYSVLIESERWSLIHDFNFRPLSYIDTSWYPEINITPMLKALFSYCEDAANRWVLSILNLNHKWWFEFAVDEPAYRYALFEPQSLCRIVRYCGLVRWSLFIKQMLWKQQRQSVRAAVGDEGLQFASNTASLLLGSWPDWMLEKGQLPLDKDEIIYTLDSSGLLLFSRLLSDIDQGVRQRVMLKFPICYKAFFNGDGDIPPFEVEHSKLILLFRKVTRVVEPTCLNLLI